MTMMIIESDNDFFELLLFYTYRPDNAKVIETNDNLREKKSSWTKKYIYLYIWSLRAFFDRNAKKKKHILPTNLLTQLMIPINTKDSIQDPLRLDRVQITSREKDAKTREIKYLYLQWDSNTEKEKNKRDWSNSEVLAGSFRLASGPNNYGYQLAGTRLSRLVMRVEKP